MTLDELIDLAKAQKDGAILQFRQGDDYPWIDACDLSNFNLAGTSGYEFRIKPRARRPREWWAVMKGMTQVALLPSRNAAEAYRDHGNPLMASEIVHVREVIE